MGGVVIGSKIGEVLNKKTIFLERVNGDLLKKRLSNIKNDKVLLIEDVLTTGKSFLKALIV